MPARRKKENRKGRNFRRRRHNLKTPIQRACTSKRTYDTTEEAEAAVEEIMNRLVYFPDQKVPTSYACIRCGRYHIGHSERIT